MGTPIARAEGKALEQALPALADMLREAVEHGAGLGYSRPPSPEEALRAWRSWADDPSRVVLVARKGDQVVGTVQLQLALVPNGQQRAELAKLIVRRDHRGAGLGRALIAACLEEARRRGRTTVWLCTVEKDAERLYARCGFEKSGVIPRWSQVPEGVWRDASFWWIHL